MNKKNIAGYDRLSYIVRMRDEFANRLNQEIGRRIQSERRQSKMSQSGLASRIGLTRTAIIKMEGGRQRIPVDQLYRIALSLRVTLNELLPDVGDVAHTSPELIEVARSRLDTKQKKEIRKLLE